MQLASQVPSFAGLRVYEHPKKSMNANLDVLTAIANLTPDESGNAGEREEAQEVATFDCTRVVS